MSVELSKILTVSARDYVDSQGKVMSNYEMVGVGISEYAGNSGKFSVSPKEALANVVPEGTEVVVDYRSLGFHNKYQDEDYCEANGTALIPRKFDNINELASEDSKK